MRKNFLIFTFCLVTNSFVVPGVENEEYLYSNNNYQQLAERVEIETYSEIAKNIGVIDPQTITDKLDDIISQKDMPLVKGVTKTLYEIQHLEFKNKENQNKIEEVQEATEEEAYQQNVDPKTMYACARVNFRTEPSTEADVLKVLSINEPVTVTGIQNDDWYIVTVDDQTGYIYARYLSETQVPVTEQNRWNLTLSDEEKNLLACIVWLEARGESNVGQEAVVEVILNRIVSNQYPNSLYNVISQRGQFTSWRSVNNAFPTINEYNAIKNVLNGNTNHTTMRTLYFSTRPRNSKISAKIGNHFFCEG